MANLKKNVGSLFSLIPLMFLTGFLITMGLDFFSIFSPVTLLGSYLSIVFSAPLVPFVATTLIAIALAVSVVPVLFFTIKKIIDFFSKPIAIFGSQKHSTVTASNGACSHHQATGKSHASVLKPVIRLSLAKKGYSIDEQEELARAYLQKPFFAKTITGFAHALAWQEVLDAVTAGPKPLFRSPVSAQQFRVRLGHDGKYEVHNMADNSDSKFKQLKEKGQKLPPHQSTTYYDPQDTTFKPKFFEPAIYKSDTTLPLTGLRFSAEGMHINRLIVTDTGTYNRPYAFSTRAQAENLISDLNSISGKNRWAMSIDDLKFKQQAVMSGVKGHDYNECMVRAGWRCDYSSQVVIYRDNFASRLQAMSRAREIEKKLESNKQLFCQEPYSWSIGYKVPISFWGNGVDGKLDLYTQKMQKEDLQKLETLEDSKEKFGYILQIYSEDDIIKYINSYPAFLTEQLDKNNNTLLMFAIGNRYEKLISELLKNQAVALDICNKSGDTPLSLAIENGLEDVAIKISDRLAPAQLKKQNANGVTPFLLALAYRQKKVVQHLFNNHLQYIDINAKDTSGNTVLHLAINNGLEDIAQTIANKFSLEQLKEKNNYSSTCLDNAVRSGFLNLTNNLFDRIYKDEPGSISKATVVLAIILAVKHKNNDSRDKFLDALHKKFPGQDAQGILKEIVTRGHDVSDSDTAYIELIKILIEQIPQEDFNKCDSDGSNILIYSIQFGSSDEVTKLIINNSSPENVAIKNDSSDTALVHAIRKEREEIAILLIEIMTNKDDLQQAKDCIQELEAMPVLPGQPKINLDCTKQALDKKIQALSRAKSACRVQ